MVGGGGGITGTYPPPPTTLHHRQPLHFKGNLAHKLTGLYFLCFSFRLDIFNTLNAKIVEILINLGATHGRKFSFGNPLNFGFPNDYLGDIITLGNSLKRKL